MWLSLGVTISCALGAYLYGTWIFPAAVVLISLALFVLVITYWFPKLKVVTIILFGLSLGFGVFAWQDYTVLDDARQLHERQIEITVEALDYSYPTEYGAAFDGKLILGGHSYQVRTYLDEDSHL